MMYVGRRPTRLAMLGGGAGAFIGPVHRMAARLDGEIVLVAGAFSADPASNRRTLQELHLDPTRVFDDWRALLDGEAARPADERAEIVAIVTPNHLHAQMAIAAAERGFAVFCEKPLARDLPEARAVAAAVTAARTPFGIAYTYLGYPLVREARARIAAGEIGAVRRIGVSYTQGWLAQRVEEAGNAQAGWRTDPRFAGAGGCVADIGVHAQMLAEYVSGHSITAVAADLRATLPGRALDDDGAMLLRFEDPGVRGTLIASQVCAGDQNRLELRIAGDTGTITWAQEAPGVLHVARPGLPALTITADPAMLIDAVARARCRVPAGHPEGYVEAFANLYREFARDVRGDADVRGDVPGVAAGVRSMKFIDASLTSSAAGGTWQAIAD